MNHNRQHSRRVFLQHSGAAGIGLASNLGFGQLSRALYADEMSLPEVASLVSGIKDPEIRAGVEAAIVKNMIPPANEIYYPGHFNITADGKAFGGSSTWPGLDSWQMAGAYLLLGGYTRMVCDYFEFVRASQRNDGNIPFAIFSGPGRLGLKRPDDVFTYEPPKRKGLPASSQLAHQWVGMFEHWLPKANPLSRLAPVCYVLTASEIFDATNSMPWLRERLPSIEAAARHLLSRTSDNGLIDGSGFYLDLPPRYGFDGVTQCYVIHAFRTLASLFGAVADETRGAVWTAHADRLAEAFVAAFWRKDHFGEYVHAKRGLVDSRGLSDTNWAAVAFGVATGRNLNLLWPRLLDESSFWHGDMPTQLVSKPFTMKDGKWETTYEEWEYNQEPIPENRSPVKEVAAMGRVWYLEATACQLMKDHKRLVESVRKVCQRGLKDGGYWYERYYAQPDGTATAGRVSKYCEYAAILVRVVLGNRDIFFQ